MPQCIDLTGPKSVARQTLATMSASGKEAVEAAIGKTLKGHINKAVKSTILDVITNRAAATEFTVRNFSFREQKLWHQPSQN